MSTYEADSPRVTDADRGEEMTLVHRGDIPELRTVVVDGVEHDLGLLKDFNTIPAIKAFIPQAARLAMSWVRLEAGESLEPHVHPIRSMIVVAGGSGETESGEAFGDGDIMLIPSGVRHGYTGRGSDGFWALAIQFEVRGLYEEPDDALVAFDEVGPVESVADLLARNKRYELDYRASRMFRLLASGMLDRDPVARERLLDGVQVFSSNFQRALLARSAFTDDPTYARVFRDHLGDEFGHDTTLAAERDRGTTWDPILDSTTSWFITKLMSLDDAARVVLVHLVLEAGSDAISSLGREVFGPTSETTYFLRHSELDAGHRSLGVELIATDEPSRLAHLAEVQRQGWAMMTQVCNRIAECAMPSFA